MSQNKQNASKPVDRSYWKDPASYPEGWARRAQMAANWLPTQGRVADIGCGAPMALRRFLAPTVEYVPADMTQWAPHVQVVDLDAGDFPTGRFDGIALLGVLEYLRKPAAALRRARSTSPVLVTSYCHPRGASTQDFRAGRGWINAFGDFRFAELLAAEGWAIVEKTLYSENPQMAQFVYRCEACEPAPKPVLGALAQAVRADKLSYLRPEKMTRLESALARVVRERVPGAFVEFGVALGGSAIVMADAARRDGRPFLGFDVFGMIPPPTSEQDDLASRERYELIASGRSSGIGGETYYGYRQDLLADVTAAFQRHGIAVDGERVKLVKGLFQDTWPSHAVAPVAMAHVDCDWYDPVAFCLEALASTLAPGGLVLIDDYHDYSGARTATDAFLATHPEFVMEEGANPLLRRTR
jgi:asparagine synthase (glutamine-hydrolysing)